MVDPLRESACVVDAVVVCDAQEHDESGVNGSDDLSGHAHLCAGNPLEHNAHGGHLRTAQ